MNTTTFWQWFLGWLVVLTLGSFYVLGVLWLLDRPWVKRRPRLENGLGAVLIIGIPFGLMLALAVALASD